MAQLQSPLIQLQSNVHPEGQAAARRHCLVLAGEAQGVDGQYEGGGGPCKTQGLEA